MDVVVRAVNQRFVDEVVFPVFAHGASDTRGALERLYGALDDHETRIQIEALLDRGADGGWSEVETDRWQDVVYRLLFSEWQRTPAGWVLIGGQEEAYAARLDEAVHTALMISDPLYPYWDPAEAARQREQLLMPPFLERGLAGFLSGIWEPFPSFAPGEVLTTRGTNIYRPNEALAISDWSHRSRDFVDEWSAELPRTLRELLQREIDRLKPVEIPEAKEVLDYWLGTVSQPPALNVAFSGLGASAIHWVRDIAALAGQVRKASAREQGLTAIVTGGHRAWF
jgi:hypothetical protein